MTPRQKTELKKETALRLQKPYTDSLDWLRRCRVALHSLDPSTRENQEPRRHLFISARSWVYEARAAHFAYEAAQPDTTNDRRSVV